MLCSNSFLLAKCRKSLDIIATCDSVISAYYSLNDSKFLNTSAFHCAFHHIILEHECSTVNLKSHQTHIIETALIFNLYEELEVQEQSC